MFLYLDTLRNFSDGLVIYVSSVSCVSCSKIFLTLLTHLTLLTGAIIFFQPVSNLRFLHILHFLWVLLFHEYIFCIFAHSLKMNHLFWFQFLRCFRNIKNRKKVVYKKWEEYQNWFIFFLLIKIWNCSILLQ